MATTTLHGYWRSSCSYRVRIMLNLKGVAYANKAVHLVKSGGEQHSEAYVSLNPTHKVPTLEIDGLTLVQSSAIGEYLEETRPQPTLLPGDAATRAHIRALCCIISNDIQPVGNLGVLQRLVTLLPPDASPELKASTRDEWARHYISAGFLALETLMAPKAGKFSVGDDVTLVDAFLAPQVYNALRVGIDVATFPTIHRVMGELEKLEAFAQAHPSLQPDADK